MAGERGAKARCEELEAEVTSLKDRVTSLESECQKLSGEATEKQQRIEDLTAKFQRERERAERSEQREKERHIVPDAETMRKIKVTLVITI